MASNSDQVYSADLSRATWSNFVFEEQLYLIKGVFKANHYKILITDCVHCWFENLTSEDLVKRCSKLNPSLELPVPKLLSHLESTIEKQRKDLEYQIAFRKIDVDVNDDERVQLTVNSQLGGMPFVWKYRGDPQPARVLASALTLPSLVMIGELLRRQQSLVQLLKAKDKEIEDFRGQGHTVSRQFLATNVFDETAFINSMSTSKPFIDQVAQGGRGVFEAGAGGSQLYTQIQRAELTKIEQEAAGSVAHINSWASRLPVTLTPTTSPAKTSPAKSPAASSPAKSPASNSKTEELRKQALERRLAEEEAKSEKPKKKKKLKL